MQLSLLQAELVRSNLGGYPQYFEEYGDSVQEMYFRNVVGGEEVDLRITNQSEYRPWNPRCNRLYTVPGVGGMLVIGVMTVGNTAQLERDVKSIREVFDRRTRKLDPLKVGMQCRFALNFKH